MEGLIPAVLYRQGRRLFQTEVSLCMHETRLFSTYKDVTKRSDRSDGHLLKTNLQFFRRCPILQKLSSVMANDTIEVQLPPDKNSTFEPVIIPKHEKRTPLFNNQIISMYSFGMTTRDIQLHLPQVYGVEVSAQTISNITDAIISDVREWQSWPLEKSYPILFLDALPVNSRQDGKNANKALYV